MIRYSLQCGEGHAFDDWFSNSADYDAKAQAGELSCPDCGSKDVGKAIMAPSIGSAAKAAPAAAPCGMPAGGCGGGGACAFANDF